MFGTLAAAAPEVRQGVARSGASALLLLVFQPVKTGKERENRENRESFGRLLPSVVIRRFRHRNLPVFCGMRL
jgi:hypothetical protein